MWFSMYKRSIYYVIKYTIDTSLLYIFFTIRIATVEGYLLYIIFYGTKYQLLIQLSIVF